ncbi:caspase family protein [Actibacterium sp. 188UL27-1]|uniref:caspase family protein n=1 Tax=Actibacterium sp. 188UL27-1 TaxID=2786961 RepID=UPI00195EBC49|nr:caspase family protein [Actibacterium sp. 188UL27-1]MBM7067437.1 SEL1-like repeat protein [Actibacterium sp. 188UL27-1]
MNMILRHRIWMVQTTVPPMLFLCSLISFVLWLMPASVTRADQAGLFTDNSQSIAVLIGNRNYRQTVPVDYAHNDVDAMEAYMVQSLGYRPENVFVLRDGTLSEMTQMFGSQARPQAGRLWRAVTPEASNVFVYYSGHGVPDLTSKEPFLLPADGDPNSIESGYPLETLYRNLDIVKDKIGADRQVVVMLDACFTGESGRGEPLLAVSAPGFMPSTPDTGNGIVKLVATSGATPANWDEEAELGLFTSRFLMGAAGLAGSGKGPVGWPAMRTWLTDTVSATALRETGRSQVPEIDEAPITLPASAPVAPVKEAVEVALDEAAWSRAKEDRAALEQYIANCQGCRFQDEALARLTAHTQGAAAELDRQSWDRFSAAGDYKGYLDSCGAVCAYRSVAETYVFAGEPSRDPRVARCDALAAAPGDADRPDTVKGVSFSRMDGHGAREACMAAVQAFPQERRLAYQLGRAHDRLGDFGASMQAYATARDMGSMAALNNIATLHENGEGVPPSPETAFPLYVEAAEGGDVLAMTNAARMLEYGRGTPQDVTAAARWYQAAVDKGDSFALSKLVPFYLEGRGGIPQDTEKGFDLYRQAIARGDAMAMATVAVLIDNGFGSYFPDLTAKDALLGALSEGETGSAFVVATTNGSMNLASDTIRAVQQELAQAQFYTGDLDGRFNPLFIRSLDAYARSRASQKQDG